MIFKQSDFQEISKSPQHTKQLRQQLKAITIDTERTAPLRNVTLSPNKGAASSTERVIIEERKTEKKEKRELKQLTKK